MLKVFIAVLIIVAAVKATDICDDLPNQACPSQNAPGPFPETEEEFKNLCNFAIGHFECALNYDEKCGPGGIIRERSRGALSGFKGICDEDTLLYAAIVDNLKCFSALEESEFMQECAREVRDPSFAHYIESLTEKGLLPATYDDQTQFHNDRACLGELIGMACFGVNIEKKCGTVAMDTFVEVLEKFLPIMPCPDKMHLLPEVIQIYKLREEEANQISNALKKRK